MVAALTIPTLIHNYQKKQTVSKLKKAYSVLNQLVLRSVSENGVVSDYLSSGETVLEEKTKEFFNTYWIPYLNVKEVAKDISGFYKSPAIYTYMNGRSTNVSIYTSYSNGRILFRTSDNMIYFISIMTWDVEYDDEGNIISKTARYDTMQEIYLDINGIAGPNILGKDVFLFVADFDRNTVKAYGLDKSQAVINSDCSKSGLGRFCAAKIVRDGWKISDGYPFL